MKRLGIPLVLLVLLTVPSLATTETTETCGEVAEPEILFDDGDLELLNLLANSITPIGENRVAIWQNEVGASHRLSAQDYQIVLVTGAVLDIEIECSHSGCTGSNCITSGCDPSGTDCTPAICKKQHQPNEKCSQKPKCSKKAKKK